MKRALWLAAAVVSVASVSMTAQQAGVNANGQQSTSASAAGAQVNDSSSGTGSGSLNRGHVNTKSAVQNSGSVSGPHGANASTTGAVNGAARANGMHSASAAANGAGDAAAEMKPVKGELEGKLNSKTAKAGDRVVLKTTQKTTTADGVVIPKGTKLIGHVTEAQAHAKGKSAGQLGIVFDRAELKNGRSIPIHSMIQSVAPPPSAMAEANDSDDGFIGAGPLMASGGMVGGARAGGGLIGGGLMGGGRGLVGGAAGGVAETAGRVDTGFDSAAGRTMNAAGGAVNATGRAAGSAVAYVGNGVNGTARAAGSLGAHATAIPGVMLSGDATGAASGMLTAAGKNVELQSGTQMVVGIAAAK